MQQFCQALRQAPRARWSPSRVSEVLDALAAHGRARRALVRLPWKSMKGSRSVAPRRSMLASLRAGTGPFVAALALVCALSAPAAAQKPKLADRTLRYSPPQAAACGVKRGIVYLPGSDVEQSLTFDLYTPPDFQADRKLPVVVFINGVGYRDLKDWGQYTSWARAVASEGLAAITYQALTDRAADELDALMLYL